MLSEYEASVLTKFRMKGCQPPHSSRPIAESAAVIGLVLIGSLLLTVYERPRAIEMGPTGCSIRCSSPAGHKQCWPMAATFFQQAVRRLSAFTRVFNALGRGVRDAAPRCLDAPSSLIHAHTG